MEWKKLGFSEQILSPKRKVVSGFALGLGASLIVLTIVSFNTSFNVPMFRGFSNFGASNSSLASWSFSFSSTSSSTASPTNATLDFHDSADFKQGTEDGRVVDSTPQASLSGMDKDGDPLGIVLEKTHLGNTSEMVKNGSFTVDGGWIPETTHADASGTATKASLSNSNVEGMTSDMAILGNSSEMVNNGSSPGEEGTVIGKTGLGGNTSDGKIFVAENNNVGNLSYSGEYTKPPTEEESGTARNDAGKATTNNKITATHYHSQLKKMPNSFYGGCDIFDGRWVRDDSKPYYPAGSCPYIDRDFDCHLNGRPDDDYLKWRWQPNGCDIPSLNATDFLERLRGKKLIFVGDSLNRNMWESMVCILRHSVEDKKRVYEISGRKEFKKKGFYAFRFEDYNCSVDFVNAPFLVQESSFNGRNRTFETLRLDEMDKSTTTFHDADIIVFNTGHWWTHEKTSRGEYYYQEGNYVHPRLKVLKAYTKALTTWARWVDKNINSNMTQVFFRGYSITHFKGGQWNSGGQCHKEVEPIFNEAFIRKYPSKMRALEPVLQMMRTPVTYLNVSRLTDYRKDGHPSIYRKEYKTVEEEIAAVHSQDCSHWCLPGVPDTWNELLYASLLQIGRGSWGS